jgi:hypothetical protein
VCVPPIQIWKEEDEDMSFKRFALASASALTLALGVASYAAAQDTAPAPQMEAPTAQAPAVDDAKLKSFAMAFLEVAKVNQAYQPQIQAAPSADDQQRLQQEAGQKMIEAVNAAEDLSVDEYNQIIEAAQTDPDLAQRINGHITEAATGAPAEMTPTE